MFSSALARLSVVRPIRASAPFGSLLVNTRTFSASPLVQAARVKKYKLKTHHAAAKRWKALASGLFKRRKEGRSHFNVKKSPSNLNNLGQAMYGNSWQSRHLRRLLPYA